ncbi:hypothetical protein EC973_005483 [Apophysomyces ossiformis]|uniref:Major facilitator superfamily (MFS) profile domain-containing protein n=1 Tax=Apophysomyces ossiformis TaxID=679940 RepID=A0A8H7BWW4_9FUNG|nr:hypothetical protein EC973_005483 [Apophysomyces ossiformis]
MAVIAGIEGLIYTDTASQTFHAATDGNSSLQIDERGPAIAFLVMSYIFVASYAVSWGPAGWIYPTELYSQGVRAKALGITTAANWLFNFVILQVSPVMLNRIQWKMYVVFSVFCAFVALAVYGFFPETMGKSLEEVDLIFSCNVNYYDVNVHHPQTAAAALAQMERSQLQNEHHFTFVGPTVSNIVAPTNQSLGEECSEYSHS